MLASRGLSEHQIEQLISNATEERLHASSSRGGETERKSLTTDSSTDIQHSPLESVSPANAKNSPPIITYPEFLLRSQKPPPLITAQRLLTATYIISAAVTTFYGTNQYLMKPMLDSLHSARHSLFEMVSGNLNSLNEKLESNVSRMPDNSGIGSDDDDSDNQSLRSDPGRFFTRTIGTQTSPQSSLSHAVASTPAPVSSVPLDAQASQLSCLQANLQAIKPNDDLNQAVQERLDGLRSYLEKIQYTRTWAETSNDGVAKVKAEIRGVKGVLLSARNFPPSSVR